MKRIFDLALSIPAFFFLSILMLIIAVLVRFKIGSPVLFRQTRPGLHGKPFVICKFRTMTDKRDGDGNLLLDGERLTRLGQFLRMTSLDELPEFFNVIKGAMRTVVKVLKRHGISQTGHATAQEFMGSHAKAQRRKEEYNEFKDGKAKSKIISPVAVFR